MTCRNCSYLKIGYITAYDGQGIYCIGICVVDIVHPAMVDQTALRECENWKEEVESNN